MIRLFVLLCIGIYAVLMTLGQDHGQKRYGLMVADARSAEAAENAATPAESTAPAQVTAVFVPAQPVMRPVQVASAVEVAVPIEVAASAPEQTLPVPDAPRGRVFKVAALGANVREGPATSYAVLDSLTGGEQVLVLDEDQPTSGWYRVRLEGDGVDGYIATRLLIQAE